MAIGTPEAVDIGRKVKDIEEYIQVEKNIDFDDITFWICSLGVEQNGSIAGQLGDDIRQSPFARVLEAPSVTCVYAVQNDRLDMYTRVWCVYECYLSAEVLKKKVVPVGSGGENAVDVRNAQASVQADKDKIMAAIAGFEEHVNKAVEFIKDGRTLHDDDMCVVM